MTQDQVNAVFATFIENKKSIENIFKKFESFEESSFEWIKRSYLSQEMQAALRQVDGQSFPSLKRLHAAQGSPAMPTPATVATRINAAEAQLAGLPSGSFVDLRALSATACPRR